MTTSSNEFSVEMKGIGLVDKMKGFGVKALFLNKGMSHSLRKGKQRLTLVTSSSFFVRPLTPYLIPPDAKPFLDSGRDFRLFVSKLPEENFVMSIIYVFISNVVS